MSGGFQSIGRIAAQMVTVRSRVDLTVGDATVTVLVAEGTGQMIWHRGQPGALAGQAIFNDFIGPDLGDQLRALAAVVDQASVLQQGDVK